MRVRIRASHLPGRTFGDPRPDGCLYEDVMVGVQRGRDVEQLTAGDADGAVFELELQPKGERDAGGPYAQGKPGERFLYLCWVAGPQHTMFRRAKLMLADVPAATWREAVEGDAVLEASLDLTDGRGEPLCARVKPDAISWRASAV